MRALQNSDIRGDPEVEKYTTMATTTTTTTPTMPTDNEGKGSRMKSWTDEQKAIDALQQRVEQSHLQKEAAKAKKNKHRSKHSQVLMMVGEALEVCRDSSTASTVAPAASNASTADDLRLALPASSPLSSSNGTSLVISSTSPEASTETSDMQSALEQLAMADEYDEYDEYNAQRHTMLENLNYGAASRRNTADLLYSGTSMTNDTPPTNQFERLTNKKRGTLNILFGEE